MLWSYQFGFRRGHSTQHACIAISDFIYDALDKNKFAIIVALDIAKAFDKVNRNILIQKLKWYGISSEIIDSFLNNRSQFVSLVKNDKTLTSSMKATLLGVSQGSSLRNLLFAVYMNDFPHVIVHSVPILFADDDYLMISGNLNNIAEVIVKLEIDLKSANQWMEAKWC